MTWEETVNTRDVQNAFFALERELQPCRNPVYILVILKGNVQFPVHTTVIHALPVYRNRKVEAWLVVGGNHFARSIASFLARWSGRRNVYWFQTEQEALAHLHELQRLEGEPSSP